MFYIRCSRRSRFLALMIAMMAIVLTAGVTAAHVKQAVGQYTIFVGFKSEPAIVEQPNAVDVLVRQGDSEDAPPVTGLAGSLKADIKFGNQSTTIDLEEVDGSPGEYVGNFIPTAQGSYTFRIYGSINGTNVDQSFASGPQTFSDVENASSLQFPAQVQPVASVAQAANSARSTADSARTLGIVGIIVGVLGLIAGAGGLIVARTSRSATTARSSDHNSDLKGSTVRP